MRLWSGSVARCLVIRTAVTILPGISVAVRLRLIYMLEHDRCGGNHPRLEESLDLHRSQPDALEGERLRLEGSLIGGLGGSG
jgi:hypothetical protein